jgi:hypothetical protein
METLIAKFLGIDAGTAAALTLLIFFSTLFFIVVYGGRILRDYLQGKIKQANAAATAQADDRQSQTEFNKMLVGLVQDQVDNNTIIAETNALIAKEMTAINESNRENGHLIVSLTEALTTFTSSIVDKVDGFGDSINELEDTIMSHLAQSTRHNDDSKDSMEALRKNIEDLTKQMQLLVDELRQKREVNGDIVARFDVVASRLEQATQAASTKEETIDKDNSDDNKSIHE